MRRHIFSKVLTRVSLGILFSPLDSSPCNPISLLLVTDEYLLSFLFPQNQYGVEFIQSQLPRAYGLDGVGETITCLDLAVPRC